MSGLLVLVVRYALRRPVQTLVVGLSIAVAIALPVAGRLITERYEQRLADRASTVPLVVGAPGSRYDLAMATLFYRGQPPTPLPLAAVDRLAAENRGLAVPIRLAGRAGGASIVAVGFEFFEARGLSTRLGTLPLRLGDAVVGADRARVLGLAPGDVITTDRREIFDLSLPTPIDLRVVGVLEPTGQPDDDAVFIDIETAWIIAGFSHAHVAADEAGEGDRTLETDRRLVLRPTLETVTEVTDENLAEFHLHAERAGLPITAVLVFPESRKDLTILKAAINGRAERLAVEPALLVDELFEAVFRIRPVFDAIAAVLGLSTACLVVLSSFLAAKLRSGEFQTLDHIGAPRWFVAGLIAGQTIIVCVLGIAAAAGAVLLSLFAIEAFVGI
ncbi:MAG: hypothetical protein AAGF47_04250 [Planctomycetota bacterium]